MERKTEVTILAIVGTVAVIDLIWRFWSKRELQKRSAPNDDDANESPATDPFLSALAGGTAGAVSAVTNSAQPFPASNINVTVNPNVAQYLNNHYMPLFGMVGFGQQGIV